TKIGGDTERIIVGPGQHIKNSSSKAHYSLYINKPSELNYVRYGWWGRDARRDQQVQSNIMAVFYGGLETHPQSMPQKGKFRYTGHTIGVRIAQDDNAAIRGDIQLDA